MNNIVKFKTTRRKVIKKNCKKQYRDTIIYFPMSRIDYQTNSTKLEIGDRIKLTGEGWDEYMGLEVTIKDIFTDHIHLYCESLILKVSTFSLENSYTKL